MLPLDSGSLQLPGPRLQFHEHAILGRADRAKPRRPGRLHQDVFRPLQVAEKPGDPIPIPAEPTLTVESIKHGSELFQKLECWKCHGQEGRGDGPSASTLTDSNDQPIRPYNFTSSNRSKCGSTNPISTGFS